ncbi:hypothetical protein IQ269_11850 [Tychonema sp. LEGE 07199]|uniref:hypothetical protein n=1 Tax=unclassified Tychonema TaxID=2642144 RepID=UPI00187F1BFF|nr:MULTISPECIES: hypothetical protein [unclassified Tychonema]MBE9121472.1 hypothetical protein [Tychonema sp. LEGE 07199]MBE9133705.1 hypothetical protein [Tychonema sp. LEGE 07196]
MNEWKKEEGRRKKKEGRIILFDLINFPAFQLTFASCRFNPKSKIQNPKVI